MSSKKDASGGSKTKPCGTRESGERPADLERRLKWTEAAREESEAHFRQLLDHSRNCIVIYEVVDDGWDFIFKDLNRAVETIEGVRREDLLGRSVLEVFPGVREFGLFEVLQRVSRAGVAEEHPITLYTDDRISGYRQNHVFRLESGDVVAIYEDVTERIESRQTLHCHDQLLQSINDAVISTDEEFRIRSWNGAAERIFQWREEEVLGRRVREVMK